MKSWERLVGSLEDHISILSTRLPTKTPFRDSDLETYIVKATSHNEDSVDYQSAQRVFTWIPYSPVSFKPMIFALTNRMEKTQSWVVAIKGLMLMHGIFGCNTPIVQMIGRLPFHLSNVTDVHSSPNNMNGGLSSFIRAYYDFLDHKSVMMCAQSKQTEELVKLQNRQSLLDMLMQVKPQANKTNHSLIFKAMDRVLVEAFDVHSRIHEGIDRLILSEMHSASKVQPSTTLKVLQKAAKQSQDLKRYFEHCRKFGIIEAMEVPEVRKIPEEHLERIINEVKEGTAGETSTAEAQAKAILAIVEEESEGGAMHTLITDKWEVLDEDYRHKRDVEGNGMSTNAAIPLQKQQQQQRLLDLICFF